MHIIVTTAIIVAYMISGYIGFFLMAIYMSWLLFVNKNRIKEKLIFAIIVSVPMAFIGVQGIEGNHIFSWYNIFLLLLLFILLREFNGKIQANTKIAAGFFGSLCLVILNLAWSSNFEADIVEIIQLFLMMFPVFLVHSCKDYGLFKQEVIHKCFYLYADTCVATAIGMIVQYIFNTVLGRAIGIMQYSGTGFIMRTAYFALFRGASILPIYMTIGFLIYFLEIIKGDGKISYWIKCGIILIAVALESSRTGLFSLIITVVIIYANNLKKKRVDLKSMLPLVMFIVAAIYAVNHILASRASLGSFLDNNGRTTLFATALEIWTANIKNILIGEGFTGGLWVGNTKPHNYVFQSLAQCGILFTALIAILLIMYYKGVKNKKYKYLILYVLITGLFVTDFYANAFTTVIFILVDLFQEDDTSIINENNIRGELKK